MKYTNSEKLQLMNMGSLDKKINTKSALINIYQYGMIYKMVITKYAIEYNKVFTKGNTEKNVNKEKSLYSSIARTRRTIKEYAMANEFDYFITLTIDKNKFGRYDIDDFILKFGEWVRNLKRYNYETEYLLIPEYHKDGAIHLHGLIKFSEEIETIMYNGQLAWKDYYKKFGGSSLKKVGKTKSDILKISSYITKYITKDLIIREEKKRYYVTRGLKKKKKIVSDYKPDLYSRFGKLEFENDYVKVYDLTKEEVIRAETIYYNRKGEIKK